MVIATHHHAYPLGQFSIDEDRPMKVVVIGAGFSGIAAGIRCVHATTGLLNANFKSFRFPQRVKNINLTIYEKNAGVGGTWYSNRYPVRESITGTVSAGQAHALFLSGVVLRYTFPHSMFSCSTCELLLSLIVGFKYQFTFEVNVSKCESLLVLVLTHLSPSGHPFTHLVQRFVHIWSA